MTAQVENWAHTQRKHVTYSGVSLVLEVAMSWDSIMGYHSCKWKFMDIGSETVFWCILSKFESGDSDFYYTIFYGNVNISRQSKFAVSSIKY